MKLQLGIALTCTSDGCEVRLLDTEAPIDTGYSTRVKDRVKIRPRQLVAVDTARGGAEIVWRWYRTRVTEVAEQNLVVDDRGVRSLRARRVGGLGVAAQVDEEVWVCGVDQPGNWEVHDRVVDGVPERADRLAAFMFPKIEAVYA